MKKFIKLSQWMLVALLFIGSCSKGPQSDTNVIPGSKAKSTTSAQPLPGGKQYYTVAVFGGTFPEKWVRLAQYTFNSAAGTVNERFWFFTQNQSGDHTTNKLASGYTTSGCQYTCTVKAAKGFRTGDVVKSLDGTYYIDVNGRLVITWSGGSREAWDISTPKSYGVAKLTIFNSNYGVRGDGAWGWGSNTGFNTGVSIGTIRASNIDLTDTRYRANNYQSTDFLYEYDGVGYYLPITDYETCNTGAMRVPQPNNPCPSGSWKTYIAGNPANEPTGFKRKNYRQFQKGVVGCADGGQNTCISPGGGHVYCYIQVLDDAGVFRGFVGVEATLGQQTLGGRILSSFYEMQP